MKTNLLTASALLVLGAGSALAQMQSPPDDVVTRIAGVDMLCGGTTDDSRAASSSRNFALRLEFMTKSGQLLGDEQVTVTGKGFHAELRCKGPWVMMDLPPGAYHLSAIVADAGTQTTDVTIARNTHRVGVMRFETMEGIAAATQRYEAGTEPGITDNLNRGNVGGIPNPLRPEFERLNARYQELSKAQAAQSTLRQQHRDAYDALTAQYADVNAQQTASNMQCADLPGLYADLQKRGGAQMRVKSAVMQKYQADLAAYDAHKTMCEEQRRIILDKQSQYKTQLDDINATLAKDQTDNVKLAADLAQAKRDIDAYNAQLAGQK